MFGLMPLGRRSRKESALVPREYTPLDLLRREFASLFDRAFSRWPIPFETPWEMVEPWGLEMEEKEKEVVVRAEVPGFETSELDVQLAGDVLILRAEHREKVAGKEEKPVERCRERWERQLTLPANIEPDKVEARYRNGILEVHLPKVAEVQPRRVAVKA